MIEQRPRPLELFKQLRDPVMMLSLFNKRIRERQDVLYNWQVNRLTEFAAQHGKMAVVANNGSGKSSYLIAPAALWLAGHSRLGRSVVTSSSGPQLDRQTTPAIKHIAEEVNAFYDGEEVFKIRERLITFMPHGGTVELFATDEAGKAEGYHPHPSGDGELGIFVDEGKSIGEDIYGALQRCTGTTRRLDVSSPGSPNGHFFECFTSPTWSTHRVTWKDCPHITQAEYDEAVLRYGEFSPLVRSMFWAEFVGLDDMIAIHFDLVRKAFQNFYKVTSNLFGKRFAGVDLSGGGDESVMSVWHGNTEIALEVFRFAHSPDTVRHVAMLVNKYNIESEHVTLDDGGLGQIINDYLREAGLFNLRRVRNDSRAMNTAVYANRGAENWINFARILDRLVFTVKDQTARSQLGNRYYKMVGGKMQLEEKRKAKVLGHRSPDRADAIVLAFVGRWDDYLLGVDDSVTRVNRVVPERMSQAELMECMERDKYEKAFSPQTQPHARRLGKSTYRAILEERAGLSQYLNKN